MNSGRSKWRAGLPLAGLAILLAFSGCEGSTDEDNSGTASYFEDNPYTSAARDTPSASDLQIAPTGATAAIIGQTVSFMASGGEGAYHWSVANNGIGTIASGGANQALYTCLAVGNNDVILQDDGGHTVAAHISPVADDTMTISPVEVNLSGGALNASFSVIGGTAPYTWASGNVALGSVSYSSASSYVAGYTAVSGVYGQNVITVIDANGRTASATVIQEP